MGEACLSQDEIDALLMGAGEITTPKENEVYRDIINEINTNKESKPKEKEVCGNIINKPKEESNMEENNTDQDQYDFTSKIPIRITAEVGSVVAYLKDVEKLGEGSIVEFDNRASGPLLIKANGEPFALGEVVVVDENFSIRIECILTKEQRQEYEHRRDFVPRGTFTHIESGDKPEEEL